MRVIFQIQFQKISEKICGTLAICFRKMAKKSGKNRDPVFFANGKIVISIVFGQCCGCRECFVSFPRRASRVNLSGNSRVFKGFSERPKAPRFRLLIPIFTLQPSARSALHHLLGRELSLGETNPMIFQSKVKKASTKAQQLKMVRQCEHFNITSFIMLVTF